MPISAPAAGRNTTTHPWRKVTTVIVLIALCIAAYWIFKPRFDFSHPELSFRDGICIVEFDATNHTDKHIDAVLRIVVSSFSPADQDSASAGQDHGHKTQSVSLAPGERQHITCDIPMFPPRFGTYDARIEVQSYSESSR